jgi:hypothetical protein
MTPEESEIISKVHDDMEGRYDLTGEDMHTIHAMLCENASLREQLHERDETMREQVSSLCSSLSEKDRLISEYKELLNPIIDWGQSQDFPLGSSITKNVLELAKSAKEKEKEIQELKEELGREKQQIEKSQAFKKYVHDRLDEFGVPHDPESENNAKTGCRIEGRLNWIFLQVPKWVIVKDCLESIKHNCKAGKDDDVDDLTSTITAARLDAINALKSVPPNPTEQ